MTLRETESPWQNVSGPPAVINGAAGATLTTTGTADDTVVQLPFVLVTEAV